MPMYRHQHRSKPTVSVEQCARNGVREAFRQAEDALVKKVCEVLAKEPDWKMFGLELDFNPKVEVIK